MGKPTKAHKFWAKVNKMGPLYSSLQTRCWLWEGATNQLYGHLRPEAIGIKNWPTTLIYAHYAAWVLEGKGQSDSLRLAHLCQNKLCVRADHLHPVRPGDRLIMRGVARKATARREKLRQLVTEHPELSLYALGSRLGYSDTTISKDLKVMGLSSSRRQQDQVEARRSRLLQLLVSQPGQTRTKLAKTLRCSRTTLRKDFLHMHIRDTLDPAQGV
jgi:biotin operon repressor